MPRINEIREDMQKLMKKPVSSGRPKDEQLKQMLGYTVESIGILHDEVVEFKESAQKYSESAEKFARIGRVIAICSLTVAILAIIISLGN
jgi:hypothetical protein